ncbi:MAG: DNA polymerase III subunit chi [Pararhodobacter sp.]
MAVARFYHLTQDAPEALLPLLIGKARDIGLGVVLRGGSQARMEALDQALWRLDGFLPHGLAGGAHDADQPVLLVWDSRPAPDLPNRPGCLIALDAAPVDPVEAGALERLCILFDGNDPAAVEAARVQWRSLTGAGVAAEYWRRDGARWACAARHPKEPATP